MKRSSWTLAIGSACALMVAFGGCSPDNKVAPGAPIMLKFVVVTPTLTEAALTTEGGTPIPAPPLSFFYALFDRILDPTALEIVDADGGITEKDGVASVVWSGGAIPATTLYIPNGDAKWTFFPAAFGLPYGVGPSITVAPLMGLPSGSMVTVTLAADKVRSHDQKDSFKPATDVASPLVFETEPLTVSIDVPVAPTPDGGANDDGGGRGDDGGAAPAAPSPVANDYVVHVAFNNVTAENTRDQIVVTVNGAPPAAPAPVIARDPMNAAGWTITPAADAPWPAGAVVTVTVAAEVADNFQIPLGKAVTATLTVKP